jgi:hypothetical protein
MASNDYPELRAWLERMGAKCVGAFGHMAQGIYAADFEAWMYGDYSFLIARKRECGVTTGGYTLYSRIGDKDSPVADDILHLCIAFRDEIARQARRKHHAGPGSCALPEGEHLCNRPGAHESDHHCACGETWTQVEGDNALLAHPADTKKKPERVRGFTI